MEDISVSAEMIRQYFYCPRKIYWMHIHRINKPRIPQVARGERIHEKVWYGRKTVDKRSIKVKRQVYVYSKKLNLSGMIDIVIYIIKNSNIEEIIPVEVKTSSIPTSKPRKPDLMQLVAYIVLLNEKSGITRRGILYYKDIDKRFEISLNNFLYSELLIALRKIREIISNELFPDATSDTRRCFSCEAKKFCRPDL